MNRLRPILSLMLALLVLISGTSFMVGVHHCNGDVADVALFTKADPCPMEQKLPPCHKPVKPCCTDDNIVHAGQDLKQSTAHVHVAATPLIAELASPVVLAVLIPDVVTISSTPVDFSPPLLSDDIQVAIRKFQI